MKLRDYQSKTLNMLYAWLEKHQGNPCVSLPTGSGKSVIIAELCRQAVTNWPETRILMLTRSMELIGQNAEKLRTIWPGAPMGIYSASIGKKQLGEPITIGGPLSVANVVDRIGHVDLCIVDEAHDIGHKDEGSYRKIIGRLFEFNPHMRVIGFTASPFRVGHGLITDKPAIFDDLIEPVSIEELIFKGYLSKLRSKATEFKISAEGVKKRGGEYIESDLQRVVDTDYNNEHMVDEVIAMSGGRKSWMFFCTGVNHAEHIRDLLIDRGITAASVTSDMPKAERAQAIADFKAGKIQAVTNVNCLSTGFDHSGIDLLVMARPTMSPGLYIQQVGRGMRIDPSKTDCLVLDFAGVVSTHGPITAVQPPKKSGEKGGEAPSKTCEACGEICHAAVQVCPACGHAFPPPAPKPLTLHTDDIMGLEGQQMPVTAWSWREHTGRTSGRQMLAVTYYGALSDAPVTEYLPIFHPGYAGDKAMRGFIHMAEQAGALLGELMQDDPAQALPKIASAMTQSRPPASIEYRMDGKFHRVFNRTWSAQ